MEQKLPLVSVILTTYNGKEKRFSQTIESIFNQTYKNIELIIINDASTNNIEDVILKYCKKYDNITYLKNIKNSERSYSRNKGIFASNGKYIAFLDDDDVWADKNKLKKQVKFLEKNEEYVLCGTSYTNIDENNNKISNVIVKQGNNYLKRSLLQSNQFALSSIMIKKDILSFSGLFNSQKKLGEDYDLRLRIGRYGKINNIKDSFIHYRTRYGNTSSSTSKFKMAKETFIFMRKNKKYYPNIYKAIILRIGDFLLPYKIKKKLLNFLKSIKTL